ncbi:MAG: hypothetical protein AAGF11_23435 [Myxococcota bacterium]
MMEDPSWESGTGTVMVGLYDRGQSYHARACPDHDPGGGIVRRWRALLARSIGRPAARRAWTVVPLRQHQRQRQHQDCPPGSPASGAQTGLALRFLVPREVRRSPRTAP